MAMMGFVTIIGDAQGSIEGSSKVEEHETHIEILKFDHEVDVPMTSGGQLTSGQPVHKGLTINKLIDKSTPKLAQALDHREVLTEVELSWYGHNAAGIRELLYKIKLYNALITKIKTWSPHLYNTDQDAYRLMEDITFSYEKILWSWGSDGDVEYEAQAKGSEI
jgi:type VI secretion system secreted protein Hcp